MRSTRTLSTILIVSAIWFPSVPANAALPGRIIAVAATDTGAALLSMAPDGSDVQTVVDLSGKLRPGGIGTIDVAGDSSIVALNLGHQIFLVDGDGSTFHKLPVAGDLRDPSFSPDASELAFSRYMRLSGRVDLFRAKLDGTGLTRLTQRGEPSATFPQWSPDGTAISFVNHTSRSDRLMITDPAGSKFKTVRRFAPDWLFTAAWSPTSTHFVMALSDGSPHNVDLWTMRRDGTRVRQITFTPKLEERFPRYSPGGAHIACIVSTPTAARTDVLTVDTNGRHRNRITTQPREYFLDWE